jgi:hypothetical protein
MNGEENLCLLKYLDEANILDTLRRYDSLILI